MPHDLKEDYLGDGVYVKHDASDMILLYTQHAHGIYLEREVYEKLVKYAERIGWK